METEGLDGTGVDKWIVEVLGRNSGFSLVRAAVGLVLRSGAFVGSSRAWRRFSVGCLRAFFMG
jgi:hypothetical protein